jgi:hypothetical protein
MYWQSKMKKKKLCFYQNGTWKMLKTNRLYKQILTEIWAATNYFHKQQTPWAFQPQNM